MGIISKSRGNSFLKKIIAYTVLGSMVFGVFSSHTIVKANEDGTNQHNSSLVQLPDNEMIGFATHGQGTIGGLGGEQVIVRSAAEFRDAVRDDVPRIVYIEGTMNLDDLFVGSPGVDIRVGSNKTIIGLGDDAKIIRGGLRIQNATQVIIRNIHFENAISYAPGERPDGNGGIIAEYPYYQDEFTEIDAIEIISSTYIWIDGNEFSNDPWVSTDVPRDQLRHDGLLDIKRGSDFITVSNNIFRNHNKTNLIGHSDNNAAQDIGRLNITFYGNWYDGTHQRNPRIRFGQVHILNNYFQGIGSYGIGAGAGARIIAEGNYFESTRRSWGHPDGVPYPMGYLLPINNHFVNSSYDQDESGRNQRVPSDGITWSPRDYYSYIPLPAHEVRNSVMQNAGVRGR